MNPSPERKLPPPVAGTNETQRFQSYASLSDSNWDMPFYFRKSFGSGPFRVNISRSGVGFSTGVKGFRVGTGPRGAYVRAGRGGFYYQQYLSSPGRRRTGQSRVQTTPNTARHEQQLVLGDPVEFVGPGSSTPDEFVAEINRRRRAFRFSAVGIAIDVFLLFQANVMHLPSAVSVFLALGLFGLLLLRVKEDADRAIRVTYELDPATSACYDALCSAFRESATCSKIWRVKTQHGVHDNGKRSAGATKLITRSATFIQFSCSDISTNVAFPCIPLENARMCFLPDRVLVVNGSAVSSFRYSELNARSTSCAFRETERKPPDATLVGTTWAFVNRNGGPDKRFNNNRQIPIYNYSELHVDSPSLTFVIQFSRPGAAVPVANALRIAG